MKNCIIIPARLNSSRLPGKLLLKINNLSLIENVYNNCCKTKNTDVYIATDNIKIKRECLKFTKNIIITNPLHNSGTDRVAEAAEKLIGNHIRVINDICNPSPVSQGNLARVSANNMGDVERMLLEVARRLSGNAGRSPRISAEVCSTTAAY